MHIKGVSFTTRPLVINFSENTEEGVKQETGTLAFHSKKAPLANLFQGASVALNTRENPVVIYSKAGSIKPYDITKRLMGAVHGALQSQKEGAEHGIIRGLHITLVTQNEKSPDVQVSLEKRPLDCFERIFEVFGLLSLTPLITELTPPSTVDQTTQSAPFQHPTTRNRNAVVEWSCGDDALTTRSQGSAPCVEQGSDRGSQGSESTNYYSDADSSSEASSYTTPPKDTSNIDENKQAEAPIESSEENLNTWGFFDGLEGSNVVSKPDSRNSIQASPNPNSQFAGEYDSGEE